MKKFYRTVAAVAGADGYGIYLDGRPAKVPSGAVLSVPGERLADAIVREWAAQGTDIVPDSMPLTQIVITAQDRVTRERAAMEKAVMAYLDTDLLCYRAVLPTETARRQADAWDPWLEWFAGRYGVRLLITEGLQAVAQPPGAHGAAAAAVLRLDREHFTVLQLVTGLCGSLVMGLAFMEGAAAPGQVYDVMHVEEAVKATVYGEDRYGPAPQEEKRRAAALRDLDAAREFLALL